MQFNVEEMKNKNKKEGPLAFHELCKESVNITSRPYYLRRKTICLNNFSCAIANGTPLQTRQRNNEFTKKFHKKVNLNVYNGQLSGRKELSKTFQHLSQGTSVIQFKRTLHYDVFHIYILEVILCYNLRIS